jgi:hypothetical protein
MRLGLGLGLTNVRGGAAPVFDPATLSLTGWWRASYSASPWVGTASAGSSGSRNLTEATNAPSVGAAVSGYDPAEFDGVNDRFFNIAWTTLFSAGAGSVAVIFNADTAAAESSGLGYDEPTLIGDGSSGNFGLSVHTTGGVTRRVRAHFLDGGGYKTRVQTISLSTWNLAVMRWDSANMTLNLNSLAASSVACGALSGAAGNALVGLNYTAAAAYDGKIAEIICSQSAWDDATVTSIKSYVNARYGLAL